MTVVERLQIPTIGRAPKNFDAMTTDIDVQHESEIVESIWERPLAMSGCVGNGFMRPIGLLEKERRNEMNHLELIEKAAHAYHRKCQRQGWIYPEMYGSSVEGSRVILRWGTAVVAIYEVYSDHKLRWLEATERRMKNYEKSMNSKKPVLPKFEDSFPEIEECLRNGQFDKASELECVRKSGFTQLEHETADTSGGTPPRVRCSRLWSGSVATRGHREGSTASAAFSRTAC